LFAEAKQWHGLGRAWRRGLSKMRVQCLLIAAVLNFKRLAAVLLGLLAISDANHSLRDALRAIWGGNIGSKQITLEISAEYAPQH